MKTYLANSYQEIYSIVSEIKRSHFENSEIWFRGQGMNTYLLKPSLFRTDNGIKKEKEIFFEYKRLAAGIGLSRDSEWETLIDMQHYGVPTRLLDWTSNLGVSLGFERKSREEISCGSHPYHFGKMDANRLRWKNGLA